YVDYCQWQSEISESANESASTFWREQNPATRRSLQLPWEVQDTAPAPQQSIFLTLAPEKIESVSARFSTSPATLLQACWQTLFWRLTGEQSIVINNVFEGRNHEDLHEAFGLFAISAPLNSIFDEDKKFSVILSETEQVRRTAETFLNYIPDESQAI